MVFSRNCCNNTIEPIQTSFNSNLTLVDNDHKLKLKSLLQEMIKNLGFSCFAPPSQSSTQKGSENCIENNNLEHNKAWLLAESGGSCDAKQSSLRFSFCSQVEIESMSVSSSCASATVLMVNLDNGLIDSRGNELKWRRIYCRLEKKRGVRGLSWSARYKIAIGIAEAISYLHNGTDRCVVHRDIKPSNILLSSKKMPKAKPQLHLGALEKLIDLRLRLPFKKSKQVANSACLHNRGRNSSA
ncbi:hypothetical protein LIER_23011 [Lithospermum erythrorhizon]|uniref:Protein kinase domain-containing protein n=1 Tax=Lithospermum erythrorhizon TaxID=34254 RepID=A0AAV3QW45_LITER